MTAYRIVIRGTNAKHKMGNLREERRSSCKAERNSEDVVRATRPQSALPQILSLPLDGRRSGDQYARKSNRYTIMEMTSYAVIDFNGTISYVQYVQCMWRILKHVDPKSNSDGRGSLIFRMSRRKAKSTGTITDLEADWSLWGRHQP